jgi:hypothetical protein
MKKNFPVLILISIFAILCLIYLYYQKGKEIKNELPQVEYATLPTYVNDKYGISITYPPSILATSTFRRSYMALDHWSIFDTGETNSGESLIAFVVPSSNEVTAAELRVGVSSDKNQVAKCTTPPSNIIGESGTEDINGVSFVTFRSEDAAMSHYLKTKSYRVIHNNNCYALDAVITGTNPDVYDPPRTPPFNSDAILPILEMIANTTKFTS